MSVVVEATEGLEGDIGESDIESKLWRGKGLIEDGKDVGTFEAEYEPTDQEHEEQINALEEGRYDNNVFDNSFDEQNQESFGDSESELLNEEDSVKVIFERAKHYFPAALDDLDVEGVLDLDYRYGIGQLGARSPTEFIKATVLIYVEGKLDALDEQRKEFLMKRENAEELCNYLNMNSELIELKFEANKNFEKEFGFNFKAPIFDIIYHLIDFLDFDNPCGQVNGRIEEVTACSMKGELDSLHYMGVSVKPGEIQNVIKVIEAALAEKGLADAFMHGTTASNLSLIKKCGYVEPSDLGKHDFGKHGLYTTFKGELARALSYAFSRSWPYLGKRKKCLPITKITRDNPSVVVFTGKPEEEDIFHVGHHEYPLSDCQLKKQLPGTDYSNFMKEQKAWRETDPTDRKWKYFVKLARWRNIVPEGWKVFHGWLHDSDYLVGTDNRQEPRIDVDRWEQYSFKNPNGTLNGNDLYFIELFIDWSEWVGKEPPDQSYLEKEKKATLADITKKKVAERQRRVRCR